MKTAFTGARLNVIIKEGSLPQGMMIQNAYTEMHNSSKSVTIMVRNGAAYPQTLKKKIPVAKVVADNQVPEVQIWPGMINTLDEVQSIQTLRMTTEQRQEKLFEKLDLSGLGSLLLELADSAHSLLAKYHDIFSLESCELICTHLMEHVIKVANDASFKDQFRQIPLSLVEEVRAHLWEMLDLGAIAPARAHGVTLQYWFERKTAVLIFAQTFAISIPTWRRIPIHCHRSKRHSGQC